MVQIWQRLLCRASICYSSRQYYQLRCGLSCRPRTIGIESRSKEGPEPHFKMSHPAKRLKISSGEAREEEAQSRSYSSQSIPPALRTPNRDRSTLASLSRSITPPPLLHSRSSQEKQKTAKTSAYDGNSSNPISTHNTIANLTIRSPIQLTHVRDLPANSDYNVDAIKLRDILGDPMIRECWQFNYMFDVDFLMSQFDEDVRSLVNVKVVHGSWKRESSNRMMIDEGCSRYSNVEPIVAYMPEPFGTHHSKMMILLRHDDLAQVVIHTANMISGDWANMCQAVWRSPLLPLQKRKDIASSSLGIGSGTRFKRDLLSYLAAYGPRKTGSLVQQLGRFDFSAVRAALVASVPSKQRVHDISIGNSKNRTLWGWPALRDVLSHIPIRQGTSAARTQTPHIVAQISSVATLGQTDKWLREVFFDSLSPNENIRTHSYSSSRTGHSSNSHSYHTTQNAPRRTPKYSIIFPTPDEIRRSLNGYASGGSIHMKLQTPAQQRQLRYLHPYLCQWAGDNDSSNSKKQNAGRRRAAPHIKTYIRFSNTERMDSIDWAMVSSANLSTQAWGAAINANGEVRICSWEIGVVVWPDLFIDDHNQPHGEEVDGDLKRRRVDAKMVPCFRRDLPSDDVFLDAGCSLSDDAEGLGDAPQSVVVGLRMPYDLPLTPYRSSDVPWCATAIHTEPDWLGRTWVE